MSEAVPSYQRFLRLTAFCGLLLIASLLAVGSYQRQRAFLQRGSAVSPSLPISFSELTLGVNVELRGLDSAAQAAQLDAIAATPSIRSVKQTFFYSPAFDWAAAEQIAQAVDTRDLSLVVLLDGHPDNQFAPVPPETFAAFAGEFAQRIGPAVDAWMIWDEPNLSSHWGGEKVNPDHYAALLSAASRAIRAEQQNAVIVAAPLAPTVEQDTLNMANWLYLQKLYEAGAAESFDVAAGKPYGFDHSPLDRTVDPTHLNFSHIALMREIMERNGDAGTALWAGNWGWNSLPDGWTGDESIWGSVSAEQQVDYTQQALERVQREWPWMGTLFLEHWQPAAEPDDPRWGFQVADSPLAQLQIDNQQLAQPGFHFPQPNGVGQTWSEDWDFSAEFGADSSEKYSENGDVRDSMTFEFWGTSVAVRVRRADFRGRLYVTVDDQPANARPRDEYGSIIVLDAPNPNEDYISTELIATGLGPGPHTLKIVAHRGWDQWALQGFSVGYDPAHDRSGLTLRWSLVAITALLTAASAARVGRQGWQTWWDGWRRRFGRLSQRGQLLLITLAGAIFSLSGVLTFYESTWGLYRRLGDVPQLALTVVAASVFYASPWFIITLLLAFVLLLLISFRPTHGLMLIALSIPFYGREEVLKPFFDTYRFSPTEMLTWLTFGAIVLRSVLVASAEKRRDTFIPRQFSLSRADYAVIALLLASTASLFFTERLDVATNEWRTVVVGATLFYGLLRSSQLSADDWWRVLDMFVLSGVLVALFGLGQVVFGFKDLITAEGGLLRVQSIYGSPNNVALLFGRILPLLLAALLFGKASPQQTPNRRRFYLVATLLLSITLLLTVSKGGLLVGLPTALFILFAFWLRQQERRIVPWLIGALLGGAVGLLVVLLQVPQLASRLDLFGETSFVRYRLWQASIEMIRENPWFGVGHDNFLYAHRGRYIFETAWREPYLNHPHNLVFDFATRLGLVGLAAGLWMFWEFGRLLASRIRAMHFDRPSALTMGLTAALGHILAHGLVDHTFFLVDLSYSVYLLLALAARKTA